MPVTDFNWYIVRCKRDIDVIIRKDKHVIFERPKCYSMRLYTNETAEIFSEEFTLFLPKNWHEYFKIIKKGTLIYD